MSVQQRNKCTSNQLNANHRRIGNLYVLCSFSNGTIWVVGPDWPYSVSLVILLLFVSLGYSISVYPFLLTSPLHSFLLFFSIGLTIVTFVITVLSDPGIIRGALKTFLKEKKNLAERRHYDESWYIAAGDVEKGMSSAMDDTPNEMNAHEPSPMSVHEHMGRRVIRREYDGGSGDNTGDADIELSTYEWHVSFNSFTDEVAPHRNTTTNDATVKSNVLEHRENVVMCESEIPQSSGIGLNNDENMTELCTMGELYHCDGDDCSDGNDCSTGAEIQSLDGGVKIGEPSASDGGNIRRLQVPKTIQHFAVTQPSKSIRHNYCQICKYNLETGTVHCDDCGVCVEGFDHHCPWTSKCIGRKNTFYFYTWISSSIIVIAYMTIMASLM